MPKTYKFPCLRGMSAFLEEGLTPMTAGIMRSLTSDTMVQNDFTKVNVLAFFRRSVWLGVYPMRNFGYHGKTKFTNSAYVEPMGWWGMIRLELLLIVF